MNGVHLVNCGKDLVNGGKLARIHGVNIVNFTPLSRYTGQQKHTIFDTSVQR